VVSAGSSSRGIVGTCRWSEVGPCSISKGVITPDKSNAESTPFKLSSSTTLASTLPPTPASMLASTLASTVVSSVESSIGSVLRLKLTSNLVSRGWLPPMCVLSCDFPTAGESGGKKRVYSRGLTPKSGKPRSRSGIASRGV
jgi:hypothetical protein